MDYTDETCQKQLIKTFVDLVFVYNDKVVITFNYSGDDRTIILKKIDARIQQGIRLPRSLCHQLRNSHHRSVSASPENSTLVGISSLSAVTRRAGLTAEWGRGLYG